MSTSVTIEPRLEERVVAFAKQHSAELAIRQACVILRHVVPHTESIYVWLLEDPDEENHSWLVLEAKVPETTPDALRQQVRQEIEKKLRLPYHPFSFSIDFVHE
jgi:hypothetical protein